MPFDHKSILEAQHLNPVDSFLISKANEDAIHAREYAYDLEMKLGIL